jgi:hypothetical protein
MAHNLLTTIYCTVQNVLILPVELTAKYMYSININGGVRYFVLRLTCCSFVSSFNFYRETANDDFKISCAI